MAVSHDSETPAHGQQAITVCAFIHHDFNGGVKLFMPKRAATHKFLPSIFELPGGHVEFGEDLEVALRREIEEEFSMHIKVGALFNAFTYMNEVKGSHSVEIDYFATFTDPIDQIKLDPRDHSEYGWFTEEEAIKNRNESDPEIIAVKKGFAILEGKFRA